VPASAGDGTVTRKAGGTAGDDTADGSAGTSTRFATVTEQGDGGSPATVTTGVRVAPRRETESETGDDASPSGSREP
jgi:hypothetical protein